MKSGKPIIPGFVFDAFNELIVVNLRGKRAVFGEIELCNLIKKKGCIKKVDSKWFRVESFYKKLGWIVEYDSPEPGEFEYEHEPYFSVRRE